MRCSYLWLFTHSQFLLFFCPPLLVNSPSTRHKIQLVLPTMVTALRLLTQEFFQNQRRKFLLSIYAHSFSSTFFLLFASLLTSTTQSIVFKLLPWSPSTAPKSKNYVALLPFLICTQPGRDMQSSASLGSFLKHQTSAPDLYFDGQIYFLTSDVLTM